MGEMGVSVRLVLSGLARRSSHTFQPHSTSLGLVPSSLTSIWLHVPASLGFEQFLFLIYPSPDLTSKQQDISR